MPQTNPEVLKLDVTSTDDMRTFYAMATDEQWPYDERILQKRNAMVVKHFVRANDELIELDWLRLGVQCRSQATKTVDVRNVDYQRLERIIRDDQHQTPVALFDARPAGALENMHFVTSDEYYLTLGRYTLPETVEMIYPFADFAGVDKGEITVQTGNRL